MRLRQFRAFRAANGRSRAKTCSHCGGGGSGVGLDRIRNTSPVRFEEQSSMTTEPTTLTPTKRRHAPPPVRNLRPPKLRLPPGACDTHFHFLGPQREFP